MNTNELTYELSQNFIEYAAACNSDRAIPNAKDGLKPVAKRILYGAYINGRSSSKPHVKCAKIVGDTMGVFHPHGDSSIYGALVRLSQPWVMRYPLLDFHGNMGNQAGDGPAAYRYTEARLAKLTEDGLLQGLKKKNVDFTLNYDETEDEPISLPSIFPNLLCNPNSGIGVAMACTWAPHNLIEVAAAINDYLDGKEPMLPGPDFPTGGIIINKNDIPNIMRTGHGTVKIRGKYTIEGRSIVFTEIPYGTTIEGLMTEIGKVSDTKEIEGIADIRNESNKNGVRLVIECEKNIPLSEIIAKLFAKTNLQDSFSYNQVALVNKVPQELSLKDCIKIYIDYNIECLLKETNFDLNKALERKEILEGLIHALEDIDNIIKIIKSSESSNEAKNALIKKYNFTEKQVKAILAMRLSSLARLEAIELNQELQQLVTDIQRLENILSQKELQIDIIKNRLSDIVHKYGDKRRTELTQIEEKTKNAQERIPENVVITLDTNNNIKKKLTSTFKIQKARSKGTKTKENVMLTIATTTVDNLLLFTQKGKMFKLAVDAIPSDEQGVNVYTLIKIDDDDKVIAITSLDKNSSKYVVFFTKKGLVKKTLLEEYTKTNRSIGIAAIKFNDNDSIANVEFINEENILIITKNGHSIYFNSKDITPIGRVTMGVKGIKLDENDEVVAGIPIKTANDLIAIVSSNGYGKRISIQEISIQVRGGKGTLIYKPNETYGNIAGACLIDDEDKLFLSGQPKSICIAATDLPLIKKNAYGNIIVKSTINSITKFK